MPNVEVIPGTTVTLRKTSDLCESIEFLVIRTLKDLQATDAAIKHRIAQTILKIFQDNRIRPSALIKRA